MTMEQPVPSARIIKAAAEYAQDRMFEVYGKTASDSALSYVGGAAEGYVAGYEAAMADLQELREAAATALHWYEPGCAFCRFEERHLASCPTLRLEAALARLEGR